MKVSALLFVALLSLASGQLACKSANDLPAADTAATSPQPRQEGGPASSHPTQVSQDAAQLFALGMESYKKDRDREAAEAFRKAVELSPEYAEAYHRLGMAYVALGEREEAARAFEDAIKFYEKRLRDEPKDADALFNLADVYSKTGDYEKSSEAYRRAVRLREPDAGTYYDMGLVYNKLAKYQEAANAFERAVELDPNDYRAQEAFEKAREDASKQRARIEYQKKILERQMRNANGNQNGNNSNSTNQGTPNSNR